MDKKLTGAAQREIDADRIDGLMADLESALEIIYRHGSKQAQEWLYLNYPRQYRSFVLCARSSIKEREEKA